MDNATEETKKLSVLLQRNLQKYLDIIVKDHLFFTSHGSNQLLISPNVVPKTLDTYTLRDTDGSLTESKCTLEGELQLSVINCADSTVLADTLYSFTGFGADMDEALADGVDAYFEIWSLIYDAYDDILKYYESKADKIFAVVDESVLKKDFDRAIACLMMLPEGLLEYMPIVKALEIYDLRNSESDDAGRTLTEKQKIEDMKHITYEYLKTNPDFWNIIK